MVREEALRARFSQRIDIDDRGCWIYRSRTTRVRIAGKFYTPRAGAYRVFKGEEPPTRLHAGVTCNLNCINPDHASETPAIVKARSVAALLSDDARERLLAGIVKEAATGCWHLNVRRVRIGAFSYPVRRIMYELFKGAAPTDHVTVPNTCAVDCVAPDHLLGSPAERLWHRVEKRDGCWLLTGPSDAMVHGKQVSVKAYAYELETGKRPGGHLFVGDPDVCAVNCIRPDHQVVVKGRSKKKTAA